MTRQRPCAITFLRKVSLSIRGISIERHRTGLVLEDQIGDGVAGEAHHLDVGLDRIQQLRHDGGIIDDRRGSSAGSHTSISGRIDPQRLLVQASPRRRRAVEGRLRPGTRAGAGRMSSLDHARQPPAADHVRELADQIEQPPADGAGSGGPG